MSALARSSTGHSAMSFGLKTPLMCPMPPCGIVLARRIIVLGDHAILVMRLDRERLFVEAPDEAADLRDLALAVPIGLEAHEHLTGFGVLEPHGDAVVVEMSADSDEAAAQRKLELVCCASTLPGGTSKVVTPPM